MSRADTWMPLYIGDYLAGTMHLSAAEHGAYLLLLMHQWRSGPLPDDDRQLAAIARVEHAAWRKGIGTTVRRFFTPTPDGLVQKRLDEERTKALGVVDKRTEAGKRGAASRWQKDGSANASEGGKEDGKPMANAMAEPMANAWQNDGPSPSQLERKKETPSPPSVARSPKGSRLPSDWKPDEEEAGFAHKLALDPDAVAAQFRDYWHAKPGKGAVKLDWSATWRTWCRREADHRRSSSTTTTEKARPWWLEDMIHGRH